MTLQQALATSQADMVAKGLSPNLGYNPQASAKFTDRSVDIWQYPESFEISIVFPDSSIHGPIPDINAIEGAEQDVWVPLIWDIN